MFLLVLCYNHLMLELRMKKYINLVLFSLLISGQSNALTVYKDETNKVDLSGAVLLDYSKPVHFLDHEFYSSRTKLGINVESQLTENWLADVNLEWDTLLNPPSNTFDNTNNDKFRNRLGYITLSNEEIGSVRIGKQYSAYYDVAGYMDNLFVFDPDATVIEIANKSGFSSVSSFSRAFKRHFTMSPGQWRKHEVNETDKPYLRNPEIAACYRRLSSDVLPEPKLLEIPERKVAYVRHQGYDRSIKSAWQLLLAWAKSEGRDCSRQFGLHHSNPAWVDLDKCRYVACIEIERPLISRGKVNQFIIPGGLHAVFRLKGRYGELLPQLSLILEQWLPSSGMKMNATPAYVQYHKNHFIDDDEKFEIEFFLPVSFY